VAGKLVGLAGRREDEEGNLGVAQNRQLVSFLQKPIPTLGERNLPTCRIFDSFQLNFASSHVFVFKKKNVFFFFFFLGQ